MFPEVDIDTIKDIWLQCGKDKQALTEMLIHMSNPEQVNEEDASHAAALANAARDNRRMQRM